MCVRFRIGALGILMLGAASVAQAQTVLTLADVLARARERAPRIVSARLALEEVRARLLGASLRVQSNPEVEASAGNRRRGTGDRSTDLEVGVSQMFEPGARRVARIAGANAALALSTAEIDLATRSVLQAAASAYYRVLHASERIGLLTVSQELAGAVYAAADRRFKAGDIAVLDVNVARVALARARADREAAEAERTVALGDLKRVLGFDGDVAIQGELALSGEVDLASLLRSASGRPELRSLEAGIREAQAEQQLGLSFSKADYGLGVRYAREEGDHLVLGGLTLTLPIFAKGQQLRAAGSARATRLRAELEAERQRVELEVRSAFAAYQRRLAAIRVLQTEALPMLDENDALTTRSFEVGQLGLPDLLLLRRETLETRTTYLDALLEAVQARITLDASAAVLR